MLKFTLMKAACLIVALCAFVAATSQAQTFTTLASFNPYSGSYDMNPGFVQGVNGNFYGTSLYGVNNNGNGTVFEATPSGIITTIYNFCSQKDCSDGATPPAGVTLAGNGNLYGTTSQSGSGVIGYGTVLRNIAEWQAQDPLSLLCPSGLFRRQQSGRGGCGGHGWKLLWNHRLRRSR